MQGLLRIIKIRHEALQYAVQLLCQPLEHRLLPKDLIEVVIDTLMQMRGTHRLCKIIPRLAVFFQIRIVKFLRAQLLRLKEQKCLAPSVLLFRDEIRCLREALYPTIELFLDHPFTVAPEKPVRIGIDDEDGLAVERRLILHIQIATHPLQRRRAAVCAAANERKEERRLFIIAVHCLTQCPLCEIFPVTDPRRERDERRREPIFRCMQHQLLCRRRDGLPAHNAEIIRLQNPLHRPADNGIVPEPLFDFLPEFHKACLRRLCAVRKPLHLRKRSKIR